MVRSFDMAHPTHVEIYSDTFDESLDFFVDVYGMTVTAQVQSATSAVRHI